MPLPLIDRVSRPLCDLYPVICNVYNSRKSGVCVCRFVSSEGKEEKGKKRKKRERGKGDDKGVKSDIVIVAVLQGDSLRAKKKKKRNTISVPRTRGTWITCTFSPRLLRSSVTPLFIRGKKTSDIRGRKKHR